MNQLSEQIAMALVEFAKLGGEGYALFNCVLAGCYLGLMAVCMLIGVI